jgi:hypothetical protein
MTARSRRQSPTLVTARADVLVGPTSSVLAERGHPEACKAADDLARTTSVRLELGGIRRVFLPHDRIRGPRGERPREPCLARIAIIYFDDCHGPGGCSVRCAWGSRAIRALVGVQKIDSTTKDGHRAAMRRP